MQTSTGDRALFEILRPDRLTSVVDIGANPIDGAPPYKRMLDNGLCTVTGFEPQPEALAELSRRKGPNERYLDCAVGSGGRRTLYVCRAKGMTSLLEPDRNHLALFNGFPEWGLVEREVPLDTVRLDDIEAIQALDFLKIDVQGSELDVFNSGPQKLAQAVAIQTEVSFITLYREQPAIGAIDTLLRERGFVPHCFVEVKQWPVAPAVLDRDPRRAYRQLLEADLLYVRDFSRAKNMSGEQWKHLAMLAHCCYGSFDLALRAVSMAARLGAVAPGVPQQYVQLLRELSTRAP